MNLKSTFLSDMKLLMCSLLCLITLGSQASQSGKSMMPTPCTFVGTKNQEPKKCPVHVNACLVCTGCCLAIATVPTCIVASCCIKKYCPSYYLTYENAVKALLNGAPKKQTMDEVD